MFGMKYPVKETSCADGTKVSIQASMHHYCSPKSDVGPWTHVEVGFPSVSLPESWVEYANDPNKGVKSDVFGYVPVSLVREYIEAHDGIRKNFGTEDVPKFTPETIS